MSDDNGFEATTIRDPLLGSSVLGYELRQRLGVGGMGVVYEAFEPNIGRRAAVKVLLPEFAEKAALVERIKAEARAANAARHRGIIDIFGFSTLADGRHAIVMEFLDGVALSDELDQLAASGRRLPHLEALRILDELGSVLQAAHDAGVVHRDLKPSNIFLCNDVEHPRRVKVLDFGIAKFETRNGPRTATNTVLGTPDYMAPEQARGYPAAPSMDLYSLGVIAFQLFTGTLPFVHENLVEVLMAHQQRPPPVPSSLTPSIPRVIDTFVLKLLEKDPQQRFLSGNEIRAAVRALRKAVGDPTAQDTQPAPRADDGHTRPAARAIPARATPRSAPLPTLPHAPSAPAVTSTEELALHAPRSRTPLVIAALVVLVSALGTAVLVLRPPPTSTSTSTPTSISTPTSTSRPTPVEAPPKPEAPLDTGATSPAVAPEVEAPQAPPGLPSPPDSPPTPTPDPTPIRRPTASPLETRRKVLEKRLNTLGVRLKKARDEGAEMTLEQQQVEALGKALGAARDPARLDAIETTLQRLEEVVP